jgi:signal transduction histidine kinase
MRVGLSLGILSAVVLFFCLSAQAQIVKNVIVLLSAGPRYPASAAAKFIREALERDPQIQPFVDGRESAGHRRSGTSGQIRPPSHIQIDCRQLKRWHIPQTSLSAATVLEFRERNPWERYRERVLVGWLILIAQACLLGLLALEMIRRKRSETTVQRLTGRVIDAAEEERKRIARELHDDIGQRLSLISMQLGGYATSLATFELDESRRNLDELITDLHDLSHRLHSNKLERLGLKAALKDLCWRVSRQHGVEIRLHTTNVPEYVPLETAHPLYRIAQEALNNVVRHSGSRSAEIVLEGFRNRLRMSMRDFGSGFDPCISTEGLGLATMRERARMIGGQLKVESKPGKGAELFIEIALPAVVEHTKKSSAA